MNTGFWTALAIAVCFPVLFLTAFRIRKKPDLSTKSLVASLNGLRGLFAAEILIGHATMQSGFGLPLDAYEKFLFASVGFFFFVSAFSMMQSLKSRQSYFNGYWRKILFLITAALISFFYDCIIAGITGTFDNYRSGGVLPVVFLKRTNWFIWELLIFYLAFYLCYRTYHKKKRRVLRCAALFAVALAVMTTAYCLNTISAWYISTVAFPVGILLSEYCEAGKDKLFSGKGVLICVLLAGTGLVSIAPLPYGDSYLFAVILHNVFVSGAVTAVLLFSAFLRKREKPAVIYRFLETHSLALYLSQFIFMRISDCFGFGIFRRMITVVCGSIASSVLLQPVYDKVKQITKKQSSRPPVLSGNEKQ
ncbi:MAG: acyltransferase [Oscillospiraceae bacterium]|nr:acyltransferase [Oscillospiraceae bacterium]